MKTKAFEVRDSATFIPCVGIEMTPTNVANTKEAYLLRRAGYGDTRCILFGTMDGREFCYDPFDRRPSPRTLHVAHLFVEQNWDDLDDGQVIDVEYILGERTEPKVSEQDEYPV